MKLGGYEIIRQVKRGKHKVAWRNISEASRKTDISRPTIYKILKQHPEKPSKVKPKYMDNLEESEGFHRVKKMYKAQISKTVWFYIVHTLRRAIKIVGYNKDPVCWTEKDYHDLWYSEVFHSDE